MTNLVQSSAARKVGFALQDMQSILVLKMDRFGDFVLATPFLRGLRASAPTARIDLIVTADAYPLAEGCPYVDRLISSKIKDERCVLHSSSAFAVQTFLNDLRAKNFDLAVVLRWDYDFWGAAAYAEVSGARHRVGFSLPSCYQGIEDYTRYYTECLDRPEPAHELDRNMAMLDFLGGSAIGTETEIWFTQEEQQSAQIKLAETLGDAPFIAIYNGASQVRRFLPPEKLGIILAAVSERFPALHYVFMGSEADQPAAELSMLGLTNSISLCGKLSIRESAVLAGMSIAAISMDSGGAHIAAAMNVPVIVFSCHPANGDPTDVHSPARFGPRGSRLTVVLQPQQAVLPCTDCCRGKEPHCIAAIDNSTAIEAICDVVNGRILEALASQQTLYTGFQAGNTGVSITPVNSVFPVKAPEPSACLFHENFQGR